MSSRVYSLERLPVHPNYLLRLLILASFFFIKPASAQPADSVSAPDAVEVGTSYTKWGTGLAGGISHHVYRDFDDRMRGLPLLNYENDWLHPFGPSMDLKLPSPGTLSFRLRSRYIGEGCDSGDSRYLAGMHDRDANFWVGGAAIWRTAIANLSVKVLTDTFDNSKGMLA